MRVVDQYYNQCLINLIYMDLQLKQVKFSEHMSEETNAFTADVWFRGKKVGYAKNDGCGGCTFIHAYPEQLENFRKAESYAKSLPEIVYVGLGGTDPLTIDSNLENQVDRLFENWLKKKEIQKYEKKGVYYQDPNGTRAYTYWKGWTIKKLLESPQGRAHIKNAIDRLQKGGNIILNTNLGSLLPQK
jgi:hypothetical protein